MELRITTITLEVKDLNTSIMFYRDKLGLPVKDHPSGVSFITLKGTWIALKENNTKSEKSNILFTYNVQSKEEVNSMFEKVKKAGAAILQQPYQTDWGGYAFSFSDPDGYKWEVIFDSHFWSDFWE